MMMFRAGALPLLISAAAMALAAPSFAGQIKPAIMAQAQTPGAPLPQTPERLGDGEVPPEPAPINPPAEIQPPIPPLIPPAAEGLETPGSQVPGQAPTGETADTLKGHAQQPGQIEEALEPQFDLSKLPFPARRMRELLLEAAQSGDVEKLRPYIGESDDATMLSFGGVDGDPIEFLKSLSGDGEGYEILAILEDVLQSGYVHFDPGSENELYIWPYFYGIPLDKLTPPQRVELYRLVTHGDYEDMKQFGAYNFYRIGITPQGRWRFFVAGD
jgi:hypothetical protein